MSARMTRSQVFFSIGLIGTMLIAADADAFWKGIGKFSGPGPFWGVDLIFPVNLGEVPRISREMLGNDENVATLNGFFLDADEESAVMRTSLEALVRDQRSMRALGRRGGSEVFARWSVATKTDDMLLDEFMREFSRVFMSAGGMTAAVTQADRAAIEARLLEFFEEWASEIDAKVGERARFFGLSYLALFNSQRVIRLRSDDRTETVEMGKRLFTFSVGYQQSLENDLMYPESYGGSRTVRWISLYPAFEVRFGLSQSERLNWFANVGPALHYFWGESFESVTKASARTRVGVRYDGISLGVQVDAYLPRIEHAEFGSTDTAGHRFGCGFFLGLEFSFLLRH